MLDKLGAEHEGALHLRVDDQIHVPLAVAQLGVGQAVELLGQGQQGLGEQGDGLHPHGHLAPLGAEDHALHPHNVADVKLLEAVVLRLVHLVPPGVELDAARLVLQIAEGHLAHAPLGHEAAGDGHLAALQGVKIRLNVSAVVIYFILGNLKGVVAALLQLLELVPADLHQLGQVLLLGGGVLLLILGQRDHSYLLFPALAGFNCKNKKISAPPSKFCTRWARQERQPPRRRRRSFPAEPCRRGSPRR